MVPLTIHTHEIHIGKNGLAMIYVGQTLTVPAK